MVIDWDKYIGVGLEVNANHIRPVKSGYVTGICKSLHIGGKTHVWDIKIYNNKGKMNCISRLTVAIIPRLQ
jgi:1,4-dihydroxy-2-naphthoyl-CoA hydrolase